MSPPQPAFDLDYALARHGDASVLRLLAPMALKTLTHTRSILLSADTSATERADALHKLRGNALEMGLPAVAESTRPLELALRGLDAAADVGALQTRCLACMRDAEQALSAYLASGAR